MDGCYWSGGSEIKWGQLDQRGDAGSILLARFVIIPSSPMQPIELPLCEAIFDRHVTALDKTSRPGGRLAQTFSLCAARKIHGASRLGPSSRRRFRPLSPPRRRRLLDFPQQLCSCSSRLGPLGLLTDSGGERVEPRNHRLTVKHAPGWGERGKLRVCARNRQTDIGPPDFDVHFTQIVIRRGGLCRTH
jgi:hypothetical protein